MPRSLGTLSAPALASAPTVGVAGALYFNTTDNNLYESNGTAWSVVGGSGGAPTISDTAPVSPTAGALWYESDTGILWLYYDSFWIEVGGNGVGGFIVSDSVPTAPVTGTSWYNSATGQSYVYSGSVWVEMQGGPQGAVGQSTKEWNYPGTLAVRTGVQALPLPFDGSILGVSARVTTAPTGAAVLVDVNKNGTTIFTTQANRPTIADGALATAGENQLMDVASFVAGDYLTIDIDQVGSTTPGANLTVVVRYRDTYGNVRELPALVLLNTTTFSAASAVSINNCFSVGYENYRIVYSGVGSALQDVFLRLRVAGADATAANYNWTNQDNATPTNSTAQTNTILSINDTTMGGAVGDILGPFLAQPTVGVSMARRPSNAIRFTAWDHSLSTQYDGLTLYTSTGTMTGTVRIFGYRNS